MRNIYIDFDGTLFDTNSFYNDFLLLCNKYNVSINQVNDCRSQIEGLFNLDDLAILIKDAYGLDDSFLIDKDKLYNDSYVYKDTIDFLKKYQNKYILNILTFGELSYQTKKIECSNLSSFFRNIIVTNNKGNENIDYNNSIFIDNNPKDIDIICDKKPYKVIRLKRKGDPYKIAASNYIVEEFFALSNINVL